MQNTLLKILQLSSPALPLGAFSYSEGLEALVEQQIIKDVRDLEQWLNQELKYGSIRLDAALILRAYRCSLIADLKRLSDWNSWASAIRETSELRQQSWQMGNTLIRLLLELDGNSTSGNERIFPGIKSCADEVGKPCNYAIAYSIGAAAWEIDEKSAVLSYLWSWATNLVNAGVKLIPLGQTVGQKLLFNAQNRIDEATQVILHLEDDDLLNFSWGLGLASMFHETQYTRLFRS